MIQVTEKQYAAFNLQKEGIRLMQKYLDGKLSTQEYYKGIRALDSLWSRYGITSQPYPLIFIQ